MTPIPAGLLSAGLAAVLAVSGPGLPPGSSHGLHRLQHVVVIYLENRSFDNLYGDFPGADGLENAGRHAIQVDSGGMPLKSLPVIRVEATHAPDPHFPSALPNRPFYIERYLPPQVPTRDLVHRFYQEQQQIDHGRMDRFASVSDAGGLTMGRYHTEGLPLAKFAHEYTLCDRFFHASFGGSWLNHIFLVAAAAPRWPAAPASAVARLDSKSRLVKDGVVTPDGYIVNNVLPASSPHPPRLPADRTPPLLLLPTIGDRLSERGISWAWYAGGWNDALAGHPDDLFEYHHQPFVYFAHYADGTPARREHLRDETQFLADLKGGSLPAVAFLKPIGALNEHPGYSDVIRGERHVLEILRAIRASSAWPSTAVIVTYDENGGLWDHVAPPTVDRWGPGTRVPTLVISPFARRHFVDHTLYDTTSILALIEHRWDLRPLGSRDAHAADLTQAFDFGP